MQKKVIIDRMLLSRIWDFGHQEFVDSAIPTDLDSKSLQVYLVLRGLERVLSKEEIEILDFSKLKKPNGGG